MIILNQSISKIQNYVIWTQADSFIIYIRIKDVYKDIADDVQKRVDTSNYEVQCNFIDRSLPIREKKK